MNRTSKRTATVNNGALAARRHLIIFARFPVAGGGKRRLARGIGAAQAVRFQRIRVAHLIATFARDPRWSTTFAVTPDFSGPWYPGNLGLRASAVRHLYQGRGDLGSRMARAADLMPPGDVVIIGSDIPGIGRSDVADAFDALGRADAVFGPAPDGGYWLVGLKGTPRRRSPFDGVRWSSAHTLDDTIANLGSARIALLRTIQDIDEPADLAAAPDWPRLIR
ncbi:MAG: TIGR04282 family arsenosugar biosynthesis glycosyltransferase [Hyphomicrobium aestuarii]|nr:TIGR04282 family arsenosugar biosynthesis glycosyltransferase [Hyphomicrobium aestuarii]